MSLVSGDQLVLRTVAGRLCVEKVEDAEYPGFILSWGTQQVGVFEYNSDTDQVRLHLWDGDDENPVVLLSVKRRVGNAG